MGKKIVMEFFVKHLYQLEVHYLISRMLFRISRSNWALNCEKNPLSVKKSKTCQHFQEQSQKLSQLLVQKNAFYKSRKISLREL